MPPYFTKPENMPNMKTNPLAWERAWEKDFKRIYSSHVYSYGNLSDISPENLALVFSADTNVLLVSCQRQHLSVLQEAFAHRITKACATQDFEERWRALSSEVRRKLALDGICYAMSVPDSDMDRVWCPDSTVTNLTSRNGETFLSMMLQFLPSGSSAGNWKAEPIFAPHPIIDRLCSLTDAEKLKPGYRTYALSIQAGRARILTEIIYNIVLLFVRLIFSYLCALAC